MRKGLATLATVIILLPVQCLAQSVHRPTARQERSLESFLRNHLRRPYAGLPNVRYYASSVDLGNNGVREMVVYVMGAATCGSGGCTTFVLTPEGPSYRAVGTFTITWPPIRVLPRKSHGWYDIAAEVHGGGVQPHEVIFSFNGKRYPNDPRQTAKRTPGKVAIPSAVLGRGNRLRPQP